MSIAPALAGWDNFYVIVGSAAAGLTGLTFVVIALAADANMARLSGLKTFVSPSVIHFSSSLWISALCNVPHLTASSLGLLVIGSGALGGVYALRTLYRMAALASTDYVPVAEDWIWNGVLPLAGYAMLAVGGGLLWSHPAASGYLIGATALLLVFIGIHNVWDLAVWILAERPERRRADGQERRERQKPQKHEPRAGGDSGNDGNGRDGSKRAKPT